MGVCAFLTALVILFGTINYSKKQNLEFRENIAAANLDSLSFRAFSEADSLHLDSLEGQPIVIQFWSTWSGKSMEINRVLNDAAKEHPELRIVAAVVKDGEEEIEEYILEHDYTFYFVDGTDFFQEMLVPGVPSQIFIDRTGAYFDSQIGEDSGALAAKLNKLIRDG